MCDTCGCGQPEEQTTIRKPGEAEHHHDNHHDHKHDHGHEIEVQQDILTRNNLLAERNRGFSKPRIS